MASFQAENNNARFNQYTEWLTGSISIARWIGRRTGKPARRFRTLALAAAAASLVMMGAANAESGIASVYSYKGRQTASGESAQPGIFSAAHRTLAFGTKVQVTNKRNGRTVVVRINDRGPFIAGRIIDLTPAGAHALGFTGLTPVSIKVLK